MKSGTLVPDALPEGVNAAFAAAAQEASAATTAPTGSIASTILAALRVITVPVVAVVDYGRRTMAIYRQSAASSAAVAAFASDQGEPLVTLPPVEIAASALFDVKEGGVTTLRSLSGAAHANSAVRELEKAFGFSRSPKSFAQLLAGIEDSLINSEMEGVLMIDQDAETISLAIMEDTSVVTDLTLHAEMTAAASGAGDDLIIRLTQIVSAGGVAPVGVFGA